MNINPTLPDIYAAIKSIVMSFPDFIDTDTDCPIPGIRTWKVSSDYSRADVNTDNFDSVYADLKRPFFWSRKWHNNKYSPNSIQWEFPALVAFEEQSVWSGAFDYGKTTNYDIELSVMDVYRHECASTPGKYKPYESRTVNDIWHDCEKLLSVVLFSISQIVVYEDAGKMFIGPVSQMPHGVFPILEIGREIAAANRNLTFERIDEVVNKVYGAKCRVTIPVLGCYDFTLKNEIANMKIAAYEIGC